jgi:uncharacterized membrane protein YhhN
VNVTALPLSAVAAFAVMGVIGLYAIERRRRALALFFKPATTALLLLVVGAPSSSLSKLVWAGIVASVIGDAVLLRPDDTAFMVGLAFFLVAHLAYVAAFITAGAWTAWSWISVALIVPASFLLLRMLWPRIGGLRVPVAAYATAVSAMVVAAFSTLAGPLAGAPLAAAGGLFFYASDSSLAVNRFVRPLRRSTLLSVGLYWLGQLGIAAAARLGTR